MKVAYNVAGPSEREKELNEQIGAIYRRHREAFQTEAKELIAEFETLQKQREAAVTATVFFDSDEEKKRYTDHLKEIGVSYIDSEDKSTLN